MVIMLLLYMDIMLKSWRNLNVDWIRQI